ncbi:mobA-like NTP transferase domain protein [Mycobacterium xenopi 4042]|uniref:MobA-like NTP transferase domain protein n=1 Tax=Mycobacterium xenopi 4042 TaxID=1299334 RepID=X8DJJ0_MYCXE|nr:mobA-like NTP transferase domain protein [Mycobacterium xenopi 4042]
MRAGLAHAGSMQADYAVLHVVDTPTSAPRLSHEFSSAPWHLRADWPAPTSTTGRASGRAGRRHWAAVLASLHGDQGAAAFLRGRDDVDNVDCSDLATGRDIDEP